MGNNTMPKCQCPNCSAIGTHKYSVRRRGGNMAYLCDFHSRYLENYATENNYRLGEQKVNGFTYSVELETMHSEFQARLELLLAGYIPTSDSTVDVEFKSPIYEGLNAIKAYLPSIQWMIDENLIVIDNHCGTHFHVGHHNYINSKYMHYIRRFYHSLFVPLSDAMRENDEKATAIFGRGFGYWSQAINRRCDAMEHTNFINVQHEYSIEFRRMYFSNAEQYSRGIDFCKAVTAKVINGFCMKVENMNLTEYQTLTESQKEELKKAADKTARQIVKVFEKA